MENREMLEKEKKDLLDALNHEDNTAVYNLILTRIKEINAEITNLEEK